MQHIEKPGDSNKNTDRPRSVYIATFGCQMNTRDAEVITGLLLDAGFKIEESPEKAQGVLLLTCSVRQHAEDRVWSEIGRLSKLQPKPVIGLLGCMAENYKDTALQKVKGLDMVVGPNNIEDIPKLLKQIFGRRQKSSSGDLKQMPALFVCKHHRDEAIYKAKFRQEKDHAFVIISEGCENFCSYCVVPYVRGRLRHRKPEDIINEVKYNIDRGITRVTLLGQNVNAYNSKEK